MSIASAKCRQLAQRCHRTAAPVPLHIFTCDPLGRTRRVEQPSQIFNVLGSSKLVRHVRCYPNSCRGAAMQRTTLCANKRHHACTDRPAEGFAVARVADGFLECAFRQAERNARVQAALRVEGREQAHEAIVAQHQIFERQLTGCSHQLGSALIRRARNSFRCWLKRRRSRRSYGPISKPANG